MLQSTFLPRNKFDDEAVERLAILSEEDLLPLADELLTWLQEMNWPIAPAVAELLMPHVAASEFSINKFLVVMMIAGKDGLSVAYLSRHP